MYINCNFDKNYFKTVIFSNTNLYHARLKNNYTNFNKKLFVIKNIK